jgi:hypothetical protein
LIWQDAVIAVAQGSFAIALLPTIVSDSKPQLATSIPTSAGLFVICAAVATLGLWWSALTVGVTAALWAVIALQRWRAARQR